MSHHLAHLRPRDTAVAAGARILAGDRARAVSHVRAARFLRKHRRIFSPSASPHSELVVTARSRVRVNASGLPAADTPPGRRCATPARSDVLTRTAPPSASSASTRPTSPRKPAFADYAAASFPHDRPLLEGAQRFHRAHLTATSNSTRAPPPSPRRSTTSSKTRRGVCQDFAHFGIAGLRSLGPARALRQRLSRNASAARQSTPRRRRRLARVVLRLVPRPRLDRRRPDEQPAPRRPPHHRRVGPRFQRREPAARRGRRRRRARTESLGGRRADRVAEIF